MFKNLIRIRKRKEWLKVIKAQFFSAVSNLITREKRKIISPLSSSILLVRYGEKAEAVQRQELALISVSLCKSMDVSFLISEKIH